MKKILKTIALSLILINSSHSLTNSFFSTTDITQFFKSIKNWIHWTLFYINFSICPLFDRMSYKDIIISYYQEKDSMYLIKKARVAQLLKKFLFILLVAIIIFLGFKTYIYQQEYNEYSTTTSFISCSFFLSSTWSGVSIFFMDCYFNVTSTFIFRIPLYSIDLTFLNFLHNTNMIWIIIIIPIKKY